MAETFLTRDEVAQLLRVNIRTVERWLKNGSLKGYKLGNGKTSLWRIPEVELKNFLRKHANDTEHA
ncbi:MAG TPA: helix-turn-helix domain-containing protein [Candidatus Paceibacterota bacterium]|nr:helix-turn-helix domain-containing protein [Candidatus Paceibacterota bacterium]